MRLDSSQKVFSILQRHFNLEVEEFWVLALDSQLRLLGKALLFRGTVDSCPIHARDLIRYVCMQNATSFIIAHNHPSGDPKPSRSDIQITKRLYQLSELLEIKLNDHLILGKENYFSFADSGFFLKLSSQKLLRLATERLR